MTDAGATDAVERIERLLGEAEALPDPQARALVKALAAALVDLVGDGMRRVNEIGGEDVARKLADDELVGNLLVLSGMHPDAPAVRAQRALEAATAELGSVGVVFESVDATLGGGVRVRVRAERGTPSDETRVRTMVEAVVIARAPDVESVQLEIGGKTIAPAGFVSIDRLRVHT
jgi:hypothetical protein